MAGLISKNNSEQGKLPWKKEKPYQEKSILTRTHKSFEWEFT